MEIYGTSAEDILTGQPIENEDGCNWCDELDQQCVWHRAYDVGVEQAVKNLAYIAADGDAWNQITEMTD